MVGYEFLAAVASEVTGLPVEQSWYVWFRYRDTTDVAVPLYWDVQTFHGETLSASPMYLGNEFDQRLKVVKVVVGA